MNHRNLTDIDVFDVQALFLDRDGVINKLLKNDYVKIWEEFEFLPGIIEAIAKWTNQCKYIIIVTNQRGVGRGLMKEEDLNDIHKKMIKVIESKKGKIDKIYYCTDINSSSVNRKPNIGMAKQALIDFPEIDFSKCLMIGDSLTDKEFAEKCNMKFILVESFFDH